MSEGLIIKVSGDVTDLQSQLKGISKSILSFLGPKGTLATAGLAAVIAIGAESIKVGMAFEKQMAAVKAVSTATNEELKTMANKAKEMSAKSIFSATEIAKGYEAMAFAGWEAHEMLGAVEGVTNLAAAAGEDLKTISEVVTDSMIAFGLSSRDTSVMLKNTNHFVDVLAKTAAKSNTNIGKLGQAFKFVAPLAGTAGYKIEDVALALGLMGDQAIKSGQAGRYLRAIITRLVAPPTDARKALDKLGIAFADTEGKVRPLYDIIVDLRKAFSGLSEEEQITAARAIGGQNAMSGLLAITNTTADNFERLHGHLQNTNDAAKEMAEVRIDTLSGKWEKFSNKLSNLGIDIYEKLKPALVKTVSDLEVFVAAADSLLTGKDSFAQTEKGLKIMMQIELIKRGIVKTAEAAGTGVKYVFDASSRDIAEWTNKTNKSLEDWEAFSSGTFENFNKDTTEETKEWEANTAEIFAAWVDTALNDVTTGLSNVATDIRNWSENTAKDIGDWAANTAKSFGDWVVNASKSVGAWFKETADSVGKWAMGMAKDKKFDASGGQIINGIIGGMTGKKDTVKKSVNKLGDSILGSFEEKFKIESPSKVMHDLIGKNIGLGIAEGIDDSTSNVIKSANKQKSKILNSYGDVFSNLRRKFNFQYNSMFTSVPSLASPMLNGSNGSSISTTNAPTINFYGENNDPDVVARKIRDIFEFGL